MKPVKEAAPVYMFAAGVAAQVGCLLVVILAGGIVLGLLLDQLLGTKPLFIFLILLASIPLNLWAIYRYTIYQTKRLQASHKEDNIRDD
jgi:F0F1-type ATP synthase assembly protein I